ncbi:MAG: MCE family protein [Nitrospira sp.]|nr:MCE family protein [bacterium]MBL7050003.1 MCE family protein [Nitrospira sp.]
MYDYRKELRWTKLRVGLVITVALLVVFFAVMFAGNIGKLFSPKVKIYAEFEDIKGMRKGAPVWFSGVEIGSVAAINFSYYQKIQAEMHINAETMQFLRKDSKANILTLGLLGDKYLELTAGSGASDKLAAGDMIFGTTNIEIQDVVETSQKSIAKISDFVSLLADILTRVEKGEGTISKFIKDPSVYDNLNNTVNELSVMVSNLNKGKGTAGKLVSDEALYADMSEAVRDVGLFAARLKESEGTMNKFINDPLLYERFQNAVGNLDSFAQKIVSSRGTVNKLIEDESLYVNMNSASERLDNILGKVDRGEGLVGSMVQDGELANELKSTLKELNVLISDLKENPSRYLKFSLF